jgi:hypothetical protein
MLAASELAQYTAANHAWFGRGSRASRLRVEVTDSVAVPLTVVKSVFAGALGGRGLSIVEHVTARWGVTLQPGGKTVWFEL